MISIASCVNSKRFCLSIGVACCLFALFPSAHAEKYDVGVFAGDTPPANAFWLDSLDLHKAVMKYGSPRAGKSIIDKPLTLGGTVFRHGVGSRPSCLLYIELGGAAKEFVSMVGIDDGQEGNGCARFVVKTDDRQVADSGPVKKAKRPKRITVDLTGVQRLTLEILQGTEGVPLGHADWAGAMIVMTPGSTVKPQTFRMPNEPAPPIASTQPAPQPQIHGARVVGGLPGLPFDFGIPATGEAPLTFSAEGLPEGLVLSPKTGLIRGVVQKEGDYDVRLRVSGPKGEASRALKIVIGKNKLALTPPMGWNSWNCWASAVDEGKVRASADAMVASGLAAHGYQYINIDDCWQGQRNAKGELIPNDKFPDMTALGEYVHGLGLKFGIYSSPGPKTCAGFEGSWQHEAQDAKSWATWGVDYVKYDWCSYNTLFKDAPGELEKPYRVMREALDNCGRAIVYSLCQYGMGDVWKWGAEVGGNVWRTTGDITDTWESLHSIAFRQDECAPYAGPGHWNDPDMLIVGEVGWGDPHPTNLMKNEQILHMTMWSLLAAPLLIGCDMTKLDTFTLDLLRNDEVIDVNQDPLGTAARRRSADNGLEVWSRPLADGTIAVGLFNRAEKGTEVTARWQDLGLTGAQPVRDLWQWKDLGEFSDKFAAHVPAHGALLLKVGRPTNP